MVEKMTAVWLIILTILVCAAVPGILIWLTTSPPGVIVGFHYADKLLTYLSPH
jgi:hypothetical protein